MPYTIVLIKYPVFYSTINPFDAMKPYVVQRLSSQSLIVIERNDQKARIRIQHHRYAGEKRKKPRKIHPPARVRRGKISV
jgi:hypothetical protein